MRSEIKNLTLCYFAPLGFGSFSTSIIALIVGIFSRVPDKVMLALFYSHTVSLFIGYVLGYILLFRPGLTKRKLWLRRCLYAVIFSLSYTVSFRAFGINSYNLTKFLVFATANVLFEIVVFTVIFLIADRRERKTIDKINKALEKENKQE